MNSGSVLQLERLAPVGRQRKGPPDPADRALAEPRRRGHRAGAPVGRIARGRLERERDDPLDLGVADRPRGTRAGLVEQPVEATGEEASPPLAHGRLGDQKRRRDDPIRARGDRKPGFDHAAAP